MTDSFSQIFFNKLWEHLKPGGRDLGETIRSSIDFGPVWNIRIGDVTIPVTGAMISLVTSVLILSCSLWLRRGSANRDLRKQALTEAFDRSICGRKFHESSASEIVLRDIDARVVYSEQRHRRHATPRPP